MKSVCRLDGPEGRGLRKTKDSDIVLMFIVLNIGEFLFHEK